MQSHYERRPQGGGGTLSTTTRADEGMNAIVALPQYEILTAKLPSRYTAAKKALEECCEVDECLAWANKMHALASYARQAKDESLKNMAMRIQARAIRRCGELLSSTRAQGGRRTDRGVQGPPTRIETARSAGLSRGQMRQAIQVAQVPKREFEAEVETIPPPTVTALAIRGVRFNRKLYRVPKPSPGVGVRLTLRMIRQFTTQVSKTQPGQVAAFLSGHQAFVVQEQIGQLRSWLEQLEVAIGGRDAS
jgi:hypothetical protein